ncbi:MAG: hypothetical protein IKH57_05180 [Clostridia bacterium]|nr:hypothetical protein [Clostridia bacterium]
MTKNILLTSLDALEHDRPMRYYAVQKEFGCAYCEALQSMEASAKYILSCFPINEILVIGEEVSADGWDGGKPLRLKDAGELSSAETGSLSAFDLYKSRIAQYINELSLEQQAYDALLPEEDREKLIDFIRTFQEKYSERETKRLNRLFDEFACSEQFYERFTEALLAAFPKARKDSQTTMKWVKNYLYTQLKPTSKLEILPVNENISARYIPADMLEKRDYWFNDILDVNQDVLDGKDEINLYVSLGNDSSVDSHVVLNILDIMISTPGSNVHLKKIYRVFEPSRTLTGEIEDNTVVSRSSELVAAAHAFLNYSKTDMLVNFWENCGEHDERISRLVYAARHVDVGISMCNIQEVQEGIQMLRSLCRDDRPWTADGPYGLLFGMIGGCIRADYGVMLESDTISFIELIKWAYRHQLYQQVLTLIETYAPEQMVSTGVFYYCDDEARKDEVIRLLALQRMELKPYEYFKMDDIGHYFVKNYDRVSVRLNGSKGEDRNAVYAALRAQSIENPNPEKISGHTACDSIETVKNVLYAYFHLGEVRNKISHADSDAMTDKRLIVSESDVSYAMIMMKESIELFIMSYEKAMEEVRDKKPNIVVITSDDVRNAADRMRRERNAEDRNQSFRRQ